MTAEAPVTSRTTRRTRITGSATLSRLRQKIAAPTAATIRRMMVGSWPPWAALASASMSVPHRTSAVEGPAPGSCQGHPGAGESTRDAKRYAAALYAPEGPLSWYFRTEHRVATIVDITIYVLTWMYS